MQQHTHGLLAVDKQGNRVLFLNPETFAVETELNAFPPRPHELLMLPQWEKAYVPIYGDGIHGNNPHPGHKIAVIDLRHRQVSKFIDLRPLQSPHSGQLGRDGKVYICCENSAVVAVIDPERDEVEKTIPIPSHNAHRLTLSPSGRKLFTDNEEDASITVVDLCEKEGRVIDTVLLPGPIAGIAASPKHPYLVASAADKPLLYVVDRQSHRVRQRLALPGHQKPCQVVRFSPDGDLLVAVGDREPVISLFDDLLNPLGDIAVGEKPMDGCFSPDKKTLLIANEGDGTLSVIDLASRKVIATPNAGTGCEVLSYFQLD
ncbi:WD40 repeat domain-containing protein [Candidatus Pantoea multigeneris]|uniref:WD40 repeat domain-containing protein n=1 Tax=Candidatus Pantoea multigeneris TaxID=2608357 RepID=A0ABX0RAZ7_9GAMM|nr:WD40 repeat domain-containing protein [Pantoea multigeneris]NIF22538.1 WD40 repeat domain-containing protein [Pantoea multigeneris]